MVRSAISFSSVAYVVKDDLFSKNTDDLFSERREDRIILFITIDHFTITKFHLNLIKFEH